MKAWDIIAFFNWILPLSLRVVAKVLAPVAVLFVDRKDNPIWGVEDSTDLSYWNVAIRNGAHNCFNRDAVPYHSYGDKDMEEPGFKVRFRRSAYAGNYISLRLTWGKKRPKGKKELYMGWTMNETGKMRPVFQLRPF